MQGLVDLGGWFAHPQTITYASINWARCTGTRPFCYCQARPPPPWSSVHPSLHCCCFSH